LYAGDTPGTAVKSLRYRAYDERGRLIPPAGGSGWSSAVFSDFGSSGARSLWKPACMRKRENLSFARNFRRSGMENQPSCTIWYGVRQIWLNTGTVKNVRMTAGRRELTFTYINEQNRFW